MPLLWDEVVTRYAEGAQIPTIAGGKVLEITGADEAYIFIRGGSLWKDELRRSDLEQAVQLIEEGAIGDTPVAFVEDYHELISPRRGTAVAHILRDLGVLA